MFCDQELSCLPLSDSAPRRSPPQAAILSFCNGSQRARQESPRIRCQAANASGRSCLREIADHHDAERRLRQEREQEGDEPQRTTRKHRRTHHDNSAHKEGQAVPHEPPTLADIEQRVANSHPPEPPSYFEASTQENGNEQDDQDRDNNEHCPANSRTPRDLSHKQGNGDEQRLY